MALTLLEAKKLVSEPITHAIIEEYAEGQILGSIPFVNVNGTGVHYNREEDLPGIGFRGFNEPHENSTGVLNPQSEALKLAGGDMDVDRAIVDMQGGSARSAHTLMKVKAQRLALERSFIRGDSRVNPREFDGLQARLNGTQLINNAGSLTGAPLSLNSLDEAIDAVDATGGMMYLIMNKTMRRRLTQAARNTAVGGYVTTDMDMFGRKLSFYQDIPILIADYDNTSNQILPFTESSPDGATSVDNTSIYVVMFGDRLLTGIQGAVGGNFGMSVRDLGELETAPVYRTRVDWYIAMAMYNGRAAARLQGIQNAAVTT